MNVNPITPVSDGQFFPVTYHGSQHTENMPVRDAGFPVPARQDRRIRLSFHRFIGDVSRLNIFIAAQSSDA